MSKIFYWMGDNKSGVEQIGYVYAMLLKQLGHDVDVYVTQDVSQQRKLTEQALDADVVVFNEAHPDIYNRIRSDLTQPTFNIVHGTSQAAPLWVKHLCLNYRLAMDHNPKGQILYPIAYPFFKQIRSKYEVKYPVLFVGRFNSPKFIPEIREQFKQHRELRITGIISGDPICGPDQDLFSEVFYNLNIQEVHQHMLQAGVVIVPSKTECLSLVAGEALALGIPVLALEQSTPNVFSQFEPVIRVVDNPEDFVKILLHILESRSSQRFIWMQTYFSYYRALEMLVPFFGREPGCGKMTIHTNIQRKDFLDRLEYNNAKYITSEDDEHDVTSI